SVSVSNGRTRQVDVLEADGNGEGASINQRLLPDRLCARQRATLCVRVRVRVCLECDHCTHH
ncbi:MAG: hypothetical protein ACPIOQ_61475, partial [Promethearchaeia archaeon]